MPTTSNFQQGGGGGGVIVGYNVRKGKGGEGKGCFSWKCKRIFVMFCIPAYLAVGSSPTIYLVDFIFICAD